MKFLYVCGTIAILAYTCWNRSLWYGVLSICGFGEFGGVLLRENVPGIFMLPRAGGHQLVHGPGSKCS